MEQKVRDIVDQASLSKPLPNQITQPPALITSVDTMTGGVLKRVDRIEQEVKELMESSNIKFTGAKTMESSVRRPGGDISKVNQDLNKGFGLQSIEDFKNLLLNLED